MSGLAKAYLEFLEPTAGGPGGPTSVNGVDRLSFAFNPKEYSVSKSAEWRRKPAKNARKVAMPEFVGAGAGSLTVELFLDATDPDQPVDVATAVQTLLACLTPLPSTMDKDKPLPAFVRFGWGSQVHFIAYLKQVSAKYTLFTPDGKPIRATCQISLEEIPVDPARQNPTSGSAHATRTHTVVAGDSLPSVAYAAYGDAGRWRDIADANGVDDPLRMAAGTRLLIPVG